MANEEPTRASVTLNYGEGNGSYTFGGLVPDATAGQAYQTAAGLNAVQDQAWESLTLTKESRLTRD